MDGGGGMTGISDMTLADWAQSPEGHDIVLAALRHALSQGGPGQVPLLSGLSAIAPAMDAPTALSVMRILREDAEAAEAAGEDGDCALLMPSLALYGACAARAEDVNRP